MDGNRRRATDVVKARTRPTTTVSKLGISGLGEQVRFDFRFVSPLLSSIIGGGSINFQGY